MEAEVLRQGMKSIGLVLSNPPGYSETFFRSKIKGLQRNGIKVILFSRGRDKSFDLCPVYYAPRLYKNPLRQFVAFIAVYGSLLPYVSRVKKFSKLERQEGSSWQAILKKLYLNAHLLKAKVDWLHFGFSTLAIGSETVAKAIGAKMAISFRGFDIAVYPVKNPGCYEKLWRYVDKVHTISDDLLEAGRKHRLPQQVLVEKITPAIDVNLFTDNKIKSPISPELTFMTTGRLHWKKGHVHTIEALALLKQQGIDFEYLIVGEGEEYERIAYAVHELGLQEQVKFLDKIPHKEVRHHLEAADIYIQYSIQEGFCNAVLEAQAMGKLCVVSDAEGLSENVLHEQTGWVVPKNHPELLAERLLNVIRLSGSEKEKISSQAIERVRKEFNLEKQEQEFVKFYNNKI